MRVPLRFRARQTGDRRQQAVPSDGQARKAARKASKSPPRDPHGKPRPHRNSPWPRRAERLLELIPKSRLHPAALAWAEKRPRGERWAAAFSGGADSLCLLLLLWAGWPGRRAGLRALHFDHRLRGAAARADARFCAGVCRALGVEFVLGRWRRPPARASEAQAREARFGFFERELKRGRCRALWLGHQRDDVAETLLMRLARGSGAAGLAAPRPVRAAPTGAVRLRPLLDLSKGEIAVALRAAGVPWRRDASNAGPDYFRNRIRRSVLPAWRRAAGQERPRDVLAGAARTRELLEEDDAALEAWVDSLRPVTPGGALALSRLAGQPRAVRRRALHRWLLAQPAEAGRLSARGFDLLLAEVERGRPVRRSLGRGFALIRGKWLKWSH